MGSVEDKNGGLVNLTEEVCEEFNDFFASAFSREGIVDIPTARNMFGGIVKKIC